MGAGLAGAEIDARWQIQCGLDTDFVDAGVPWTSTNRLDDHFDRVHIALQQKFDAAVREIERVPAERVHLCRAAHEVAKTHTLNAAAYVSANAIHDGWR